MCFLKNRFRSPKKNKQPTSHPSSSHHQNQTTKASYGTWPRRIWIGSSRRSVFSLSFSFRGLNQDGKGGGMWRNYHNVRKGWGEKTSKGCKRMVKYHEIIPEISYVFVSQFWGQSIFNLSSRLLRRYRKRYCDVVCVGICFLLDLIGLGFSSIPG